MSDGLNLTTTGVMRATGKDPGDYVHPADMWLHQMHHETRMREIREMDLEAWVRGLANE